MNAIQFIKEHGVEKARKVIEGAPDGFKGYNDVINKYTRGVWFSRDVLLSDLKRLVESVTIVEDHGGLETIKKCVEKTIFPLSDRIIRMKQAIADYEQLFGNTETLGGEHV